MVNAYGSGRRDWWINYSRQWGWKFGHREKCFWTKHWRDRFYLIPSYPHNHIQVDFHKHLILAWAGVAMIANQSCILLLRSFLHNRPGLLWFFASSCSCVEQVTEESHTHCGPLMETQTEKRQNSLGESRHALWQPLLLSFFSFFWKLIEKKIPEANIIVCLMSFSE